MSCATWTPRAVASEARPARLDYLLYTPFRYLPPAPGSRFRAAHDPGVWYGAQVIRTSCAELGYWRWRFVHDNHGLTRRDAVPHTVFQVLAGGERRQRYEFKFE